MIARLTGKLVELSNKVAVIDVNGLGYGVSISNELSGRLTVNSEQTLYIYEHIREQEHSLYGFSSFSDKELFEQLLSVNGVGPKAALAIFDLAVSDKLRAEIASGNVAFLTQASGVGKKAAERVVIDLQDKVGSPILNSGTNNNLLPDDEALEGLMALGYRKEQAAQMLAGIEAHTTEERVKQALKRG